MGQIPKQRLKSKEEVLEEAREDYRLWMAKLELDKDFTLDDWIRAVNKARNGYNDSLKEKDEIN